MPDEQRDVYCGLCLYASDLGVPGYDDKGPVYINPDCPEHNQESDGGDGNG